MINYASFDFGEAAKVLGFFVSAGVVLAAIVGFGWYIVAGRKNLRLKDVAAEAQDLAAIRLEKLKDITKELDHYKEKFDELTSDCDGHKEELRKMTRLYLKLQGREEMLQRDFGLFYDEEANTFHKRQL